MGRMLWMADALHEASIPFIAEPGWETRGSSTFDPQGGVIHHDALPATVKAANAVRLMRDGRSDLAGPLCNVWGDDDNDRTGERGDPVAHLIAAGRANHAGRGGWLGMSGNSKVWGIEARNNGIGEPWTPQMVEFLQRISAAFAHYAGHGPEKICGHKEWAPGRKIDPAGIDMHEFRAEVKWFLGTADSPVLPTPAMGDAQAASLMLWFVSIYDRAGGAANWPTIRKGASGDWVRMIQGTCRSVSGAPEVDGVFGPRTVEAVSNIQRIAAKGNPLVQVDGVVGPQTWQVLRFFVFVKGEQNR